MIENSFWKDILYEIVSQMDPWDINIVELATRYAVKVEKMQEMNFKIPANVIIVSSVLLRMKADIMTNNTTPIEFFTGDFCIDESNFILPEFNIEAYSSIQTDAIDTEIVKDEGNGKLPVSIVPRRVPKRRVTAAELIAAIQEVLEDKIVKKRLREAKESKHIEIKVVKDITKLIEETYLKVIDIIMRNRKKIVSFSEVLNNGNGKTKHSRDEIVDTFISLLYLCSDQKIKLEQSKLYDEIFIKPYQSHQS